jgi:hypothetical protein
MRLPTLAVLFGLGSISASNARSDLARDGSGAKPISQHIATITEPTTIDEAGTTQTALDGSFSSSRKYAGGTGLHDLWRTALSDKSMGSEDRRQAQTAGSGSIFGSHRPELSALGLDLQWHGARPDDWARLGGLSRPGIDDWNSSRQLRGRGQGAAALPGLARRGCDTLTDEDYIRLLDDLQSEFGLLPLSVYRGCRDPAVPDGSKYLLAQESFWEWLGDDKKDNSDDSENNDTDSDDNGYDNPNSDPANGSFPSSW